MKYILITLILFSAPVSAETNWYRVTANTLLFADMLQTIEIANSDDFEETNRLLSKKPSNLRIYNYFLLSALITNFIGESLTGKSKNIFYGVVSVHQANVVRKNIAIGVNIRF
jgi:hypothetical protein